jgi:hypothetical protein
MAQNAANQNRVGCWFEFVDARLIRDYLDLVAMNPTPEQIATRLLGKSGEYTLFKTEQVRALIIRAVEEERAREAK